MADTQQHKIQVNSTNSDYSCHSCSLNLQMFLAQFWLLWRGGQGIGHSPPILQEHAVPLSAIKKEDRKSKKGG
jgi:hypothetical protein